MVHNIKDQIYNLAVNELKKSISLPFDVENEIGDLSHRDKGCDRLIRFRINKKDILFCVEIKKTVSKSVIGFLMQRKEYMLVDLLLVAVHINNNMADELKKNSIQFIDAAGNSYLNTPPLFIFIKGNKKPEIFNSILPRRVFEPGGLKIIYALLCSPGLIGEPYRKIAEKAGVALGTVGWIMKDLKEMGYMVEMGKRGRKLIKKEELYYRWCADYTERLKPKLFLGKFGGSADWWKKYKLDHHHAQWGGEVAANRMTQYLKPRNITIYVQREHYKTIIVDNKLYKDDTGDTEFYERFWLLNPEDRKLKDTVNPVLVYADLIGTGNQRNIEVARIIYEKYLNRYLEEN